jgi:ubiquinone/menaquinone biosynthesis C-methylase UbiE
VIEFTGERVVPGHVEPDLWAEHLSRYAFASRWSPGARVLDLGCGTGYGTAELAQRARFSVGVDVAQETVAYSKSTYASSNICFLPASATSLPFVDGSFTLLVAFEVIEHLNDWRALLSEARRLLHPEGVFLVSTPNKEYYTESRGSSGPNPFHIHEFEFEEFRNALAEFFPHCVVLLQNHVEAFAFYQGSAGSALEGRMDGARGVPEDAHFFLAVCSLRELAPPPAFIFVHQASNVLREREKHIQSLQESLSETREQFNALHRKHDQLTGHLEEQNRWTLKTTQELESARRELADVVQKLDVAEATVIERTLWAQSLNREIEVLVSDVQKLASEVHAQSAVVQTLTAEVQRQAAHSLDLETKLERQREDLEARLNYWRASRWTKLGRKLNLGPDLDQSPLKGVSTGGGS